MNRYIVTGASKGIGRAAAHAMALVILVIFWRNVFSTTIRTTLLPLLR